MVDLHTTPLHTAVASERRTAPNAVATFPSCHAVRTYTSHIYMIGRARIRRSLLVASAATIQLCRTVAQRRVEPIHSPRLALIRVQPEVPH